VQFYVAILATLAVFVIVNGLFWNAMSGSRNDMWGISAGAQLAEALLPPATANADQYQKALDDLRTRVKMDFALYDSNEHLLANTGYVPNLRPRQLMRSGWAAVHGGPVWILELQDGRRLVVRPIHQAGRHVIAHAALMVPLSIVLAFALGAYPIARRLTRRLERLQTGVEHFGAGDLTTRVAVEGSDEVAALARSFNTSAERIAELVRSHKMLLANCSHELRTPLARIRLLLERLSSASDPTLRDELTRNIAELDALIGEMLLASRLDTLRTLEHVEDVDLLALAAEEASHFDRPVEGEAIIVRGDPALLRRLVRNLLDNAQQHAGGATRIEVREESPTHARVIVEDAGNGIADNEREKIFEPFYRSEHAQTSVRGFGLGLALVRQIARAHGGDATYSALPGGGSRFTVVVAKGAPAASS
jgi:signal transduction histidine kinase